MKSIIVSRLLDTRLGGYREEELMAVGEAEQYEEDEETQAEDADRGLHMQPTQQPKVILLVRPKKL